MAERRSFLLRIDGDVLDALQRWAADELRSLNGQIEYLLRRELADEGRLRNPPPGGPAPTRRGGGRPRKST
ncbi:MAG TPA: hypothetical protein VGK94_04175 [Candidatus Polarisedimenticolia bacterium]